MNRAILACSVVTVIAAVLLGAVAVFSPTQPAYAGFPTDLTIFDDETGGDCEPSVGAIGKWNGKTKTCRLTDDLIGMTVGIGSDVTLNCNGHLLFGSGLGIGITLAGVTGVTIRNCNVSDYTVGILLHGSDFNTLQGNNAFLNFDGILLEDESDNNTLQGNTANDNESNGIRLSSSDNNKLSKNTANGNVKGNGIFLDDSSFNDLIGNTFNENGGPCFPCNGIYFLNSGDNKLIGNTVNGNIAVGILLDLSDFNDLLGNTVNGNNEGGIFLDVSDNNTLNGNTANGNVNNPGIILFFSDDNTLNGNTANENDKQGIRLKKSDNNTLNGNTANENDKQGIRISGSDNNILIGNTAFKNLGDGFLLGENSVDNTLEDNKAKNNDGFGFEDLSTGTKTSGTANTYTDNKCVTNGSDQDDGSDPDGLCSPQN